MPTERTEPQASSKANAARQQPNTLCGADADRIRVSGQDRLESRRHASPSPAVGSRRVAESAPWWRLESLPRPAVGYHAGGTDVRVARGRCSIVSTTLPDHHWRDRRRVHLHEGAELQELAGHRRSRSPADHRILRKQQFREDQPPTTTPAAQADRRVSRPSTGPEPWR